MDDIFKDKLGNFEERPSELLWYGIDAELDNIPSKAAFSRSRIFLASALATLFLMAGSAIAYLYFDNGSHKYQVCPPTVLAEKISENSFSSIVANSGEPAMDSRQYADKVKSTVRTDDGRDDYIAPITTEDYFLKSEGSLTGASKDRDASEYGLNTMQSARMNGPFSSINHSMEAMVHPNLNEMELNDEDISGLHIGPAINYSHNWMAQKDFNEYVTRRGLKNAFNGGLAFGLNAGYNFNGRIGVQVDWLFSSSEGHALKIPDEMGETVQKIHINYMRVPVLVKYRMSRLSRLNASPMVINYIAGVEYGRLNWVNMDEKVEIVKPEDFNEHEWGLVLGLEYDLHLDKNYFLTLGARGKFSTDINDFPSILHSDLEQMHNFSLGITARFNYRIR